MDTALAPTPSFEYAPSKYIFHIPPISLVGLVKGHVSVGDPLYSSFTVRIQ